MLHSGYADTGWKALVFISFTHVVAIHHAEIIVQAIRLSKVTLEKTAWRENLPIGANLSGKCHILHKNVIYWLSGRRMGGGDLSA